MLAAFALPTPWYRRHEPELSPLHVAVREHPAAWGEQHEPPSFVARALRRLLDGGILANGFVRVRCDACKEENLVAFPHERGRSSSPARTGACVRAAPLDVRLRQRRTWSTRCCRTWHYVSSCW
jgi:hypothetical protein